ncbi:MAG: acyloxyacyl hydrolase [Alphaproteobacteria bacterium]|nr:acyloxyacyl hydrolase [Alphaproteobacteria bacterium]
MKKILFAAALAMIGRPVFADCACSNKTNVMFGDEINQFAVYLGKGMGNSMTSKLNGIMMLQYSQPIEFMRRDSRINIQTGISGGEAADTWLFSGMSLDVALLSWNSFYLGAGFGGFIRDKETEFLDSWFTFGEKAFIGYKFENNFGLEFFIQHFSNGNLTDINKGYNFTGLTVTYSF